MVRAACGLVVLLAGGRIRTIEGESSLRGRVLRDRVVPVPLASATCGIATVFKGSPRKRCSGSTCDCARAFLALERPGRRATAGSG
jgi:hypothetical protein